MAFGPMGQNTGAIGGVSSGQPLSNFNLNLASPEQQQAFRNFSAIQPLSNLNLNLASPQQQVPQNTMSPLMDSTMVDDFGSRNPSIFNPGMQGGLGQTPSPFRSVLPIFTQSGQANPVFDPSSDPRLQFNTGQDYRSFMKQQRYIDDPLQRYLPMNRIGRRQFANQQYQPVAVSVGDPGRGRNSVNPKPLALANPFGAAGAGIASLLR